MGRKQIADKLGLKAMHDHVLVHEVEKLIREAVAADREVVLREFPLFEDNGLDEETHCCEWALQQDRKRLHAMLAAPMPAQPATVPEGLRVLVAALADQIDLLAMKKRELEGYPHMRVFLQDTKFARRARALLAAAPKPEQQEAPELTIEAKSQHGLQRFPNEMSVIRRSADRANRGGR